MRWGYLALFALLPWSVECSFGAWKMNVPSEPLIAALGIGLGWFVLKNPDAIRTVFSNNFLLKISASWVGWLAVSACFSTMPLVSWKYWSVEAGHWWVFAVGVAMFPEIWRRAFRLFAFSMAGVVIYTLVHHSFYHFRADQALLAPMPFFPENTLYAATVGMVVLGLNKERAWLMLFFLIGLFCSFCRAAWLSVAMTGIVGLLLVFREKWRLFAFVGMAFFTATFLFKGQIFDGMAKDVSMLERLNRYACALRMAHDRPWTGFGPGTFQFQYIPYQRPEEMTRISATEPVLERSPATYGRGGGAHSEYLQALAEAGWPGLLLWLALTAAVLWAGFNSFFREKTKERQWFALALTLSLLTLFLHGLVNNMLHDGRVAALVWGQVGLLASGFRGFRVEAEMRPSHKLGF